MHLCLVLRLVKKKYTQLGKTLTRLELIELVLFFFVFSRYQTIKKLGNRIGAETFNQNYIVLFIRGEIQLKLG